MVFTKTLGPICLPDTSFILQPGEQVGNILHSTLTTAWKTGLEYLSSCSTENRFGISFILESGEQVWNILHSTAWRTGLEYHSFYSLKKFKVNIFFLGFGNGMGSREIWRESEQKPQKSEFKHFCFEKVCWEIQGKSN